MCGVSGAASAALGALVQWDGTPRLISLTRGDHMAGVSVGGPRALVDGRPIYLDVPPQIFRDRTMVPVRFIAQAFGATVGWDGQTRTV